jgi:hypothetical protein
MCYTATEFATTLYHRNQTGDIVVIGRGCTVLRQKGFFFESWPSESMYLQSTEEGDAAMKGALYSVGDLEAGTGVWASSNGNGENGHSGKYKLEIQPFYVYELNINKNGNGSGSSTAQVLYGHCVYQKK